MPHYIVVWLTDVGPDQRLWVKNKKFATAAQAKHYAASIHPSREPAIYVSVKPENLT